MFRSDEPVNYEDVYTGLVQRLTGVDFVHARDHLGVLASPEGWTLSCFGRGLIVGPEGVKAVDGRPVDFTIRIVAAWYLIHGGRGEATGRFAAYRDFKDGAFFHASFERIVEHRIASVFSGKPGRLEAAAPALHGTPDSQWGGDLGFRFPALPQVPLGLVFYDADEDFPSSARVLFDRSAPLFLDMECLAVLGLILADQLAVQA